MNTQLQITRCPHCQRNHLSAFVDYEQAAKWGAGLWLLNPIIWIVMKAIHVDNTYWVCDDCGCKFQMKTY